MWPCGALLPFESHGSQVTAASTRPATNAAPASPGFMFTTCTSFSERPASRRSTFRKNCETEPAWTATRLPLRSRTDLISLRATIPSPPAESSSAMTYWNSAPVPKCGIRVSIVETTPSSRPAPIAP